MGSSYSELVLQRVSLEGVRPTVSWLYSELLLHVAAVSISTLSYLTQNCVLSNLFSVGPKELGCR